MKALIKIEDSIAYRIYRTARVLRRHLIALAEESEVDITPEQWFILNKLRNRGSQTQAQLSEAGLADGPNITRSLAMMEVKRLIERTSDASDGRKTMVSLSATGRYVHDEFAVAVKRDRAQIFRGIEPEQMQTVFAVLAQIEANLGLAPAGVRE